MDFWTYFQTPSTKKGLVEKSYRIKYKIFNSFTLCYKQVCFYVLILVTIGIRIFFISRSSKLLIYFFNDCSVNKWSGYTFWINMLATVFRMDRDKLFLLVLYIFSNTIDEKEASRKSYRIECRIFNSLTLCYKQVCFYVLILW